MLGVLGFTSLSGLLIWCRKRISVFITKKFRDRKGDNGTRNIGIEDVQVTETGDVGIERIRVVNTDEVCRKKTKKAGQKNKLNINYTPAMEPSLNFASRLLTSSIKDLI